MPAFAAARRAMLHSRLLLPAHGPLASDGAQMKNGVTLAAAEINAAGGIAGKKIILSILDTDVTDRAKIKTSLQKHVNDKVDALYEGYLIQWPASMDIKANYGAPALDASTSIDQVKQIQGSAKYGNIFQIDPPESYYGLGFPGFLNNVKKSGKWEACEQQDLHRRGRLRRRCRPSRSSPSSRRPRTARPVGGSARDLLDAPADLLQPSLGACCWANFEIVCE